MHAASTFAGAGSGEGRITVARNGSPCGMAYAQDNRQNTGFVAEPQLVLSPKHGSASVRMSGGMAMMTYTPERDFVGSDQFRVALGPTYMLTVDVDVVPLP